MRRRIGTFVRSPFLLNFLLIYHYFLTIYRILESSSHILFSFYYFILFLNVIFFRQTANFFSAVFIFVTTIQLIALAVELFNIGI